MKPRTMRRNLLVEATVALALARLAVRVVSTQRLLVWARRPGHHDRFADPSWVKSISWAIDCISAKRWMRASCLPRALAARAMLQRRGIATRLCLGVARDDGALAAHAWLELGQEAIVGGGEAPRFSRLIEFG